MKINLNNIVPAPMAGIVFDTERLWNKNITLASEKNILVKAASGRGKSTLISYLYGLRKDYIGNITIDEKDLKVTSLDEWALIRQQKISVVFQDLRLFQHLTVRENIEIKYNLNSDIEKSEISRMIEHLGITPQINQTCGTLSLGQQQRVAIIRALVQPFQILLLDEPFSHLDKENIQLALQLITDRCKTQNATMLLTSLGDEHAISFDRILFV